MVTCVSVMEMCKSKISPAFPINLSERVRMVGSLFRVHGKGKSHEDTRFVVCP